ncbi:MAG: restriction endonuclease subunit S [Muribaculaceae bacterium]|nr:restriction endonuclease subunit S [Muribaculaceae bacterium]
MMQQIKKKWADVVVIISGKNQKEVVNPNGKYPIYGSGGVIGYADDFLCEAGTTIVGRKGTINSPIYVEERFWNVDTAFGIYPKKEVLPKYLFFFCQSFNFKALDKSTTIPSLAKRDLLNIEMPVPVLSEQERIVRYIEENFSQLDNGEQLLQKTKQQLTVYRQAVLKEAFSGCEHIKLQDVCQSITDGDHMPPPKSKEGIPFIMISNINNHMIDWEDTAYVGKDYYDAISDTRKPRQGDVLYTVTGSFGISVLIDFEKDFCFQRHIALLRPNEIITQKFLYYALQSSDVYIQASKGATGTAQKTVGLRVLRELEIPYVSNKERQRKIVIDMENKLSVYENIAEAVDNVLQQVEAMRQSILKSAFEGRISS